MNSYVVVFSAFSRLIYILPLYIHMRHHHFAYDFLKLDLCYDKMRKALPLGIIILSLKSEIYLASS